MFRSHVRRVGGVVVVTISLVLASPAAAAGREGGTRKVVRSVGAVDSVVLVLRQVGVVYPVAGLVANWLAEGSLIDPNGTPLPVNRVVIPGVNSNATTGTYDEGPLIDPNG